LNAAGGALGLDELMTFGLGLLRLPPAAFWAMTPRELSAAMRVWVAVGDERIGRGNLSELMRKFPDR
jgi:uncharacterized phage protein (TIGR02216 family)